MHYFVTGHNGFKGSWLTMLLNNLGHEVTGFSLPERPGSLFARANLNQIVRAQHIGDIRNSQELWKAIVQSSPDRVIHLAAQPLVHHSYEYPRETYESNVIGTLNLLEAVEKYSPSTPTLVITTDKVYTPSSASEALTEVAPLGGGTDPYSASKAMADILSASWSKSNPESKLAIARAGNVIGGGDDSSGRLIPDIINAYLAGVEPVLRHPHSVRPWQHVLDCLSGYLTLMDAIQAQGAAGAWNFGPNSEDNRTVLDVVQEVAKSLEVEPRWAQDQGKYMPETSFLALDSSKARSQLRWEPRWSFEDSIKKTSEWERNVALGKSPFEVTNLQVMDFLFDR